MNNSNLIADYSSISKNDLLMSSVDGDSLFKLGFRCNYFTNFFSISKMQIFINGFDEYYYNDVELDKNITSYYLNKKNSRDFMNCTSEESDYILTELMHDCFSQKIYRDSFFETYKDHLNKINIEDYRIISDDNDVIYLVNDVKNYIISKVEIKDVLIKTHFVVLSYLLCEMKHDC